MDFGKSIACSRNKSRRAVLVLDILLVCLGHRGYAEAYAQALTDAGHQVSTYVGLKPYDYITRLRRVVRVRIPNIFGRQHDYLRSEQIAFQQSFRRFDHRFDLVLFMNAHSLATDELIDEIGTTCNAVGLWMLDDVDVMHTSRLNLAAFSLLASFNRQQTQLLTRELGREVAYVPQGFAPINSGASRNWSDRPLILGAPYPSRRDAARCLVGAGYQIEVVGRTWPEWIQESRQVHISGDVALPESLALSARSRICVNGHRDVSTGVSPRVFEIAGAGGLIVTDNEQSTEFFDPGVEMLLWCDTESLIDQVGRAVHNRSYATSVAQRGYSRVRAEHTMAVRFEQLLAAWGL